MRAELRDVLVDTYDQSASALADRKPHPEVVGEWARQVRRRRRVRAVMVAAAVVPSIAGLTIGIVYGLDVLLGHTAPVEPAGSPTFSAEARPSSPYPLPVIPRAEIDGYEGWWGYTYKGAMPSLAVEHPVTILVNTWTGEVVESFERAGDGTSRPVSTDQVREVPVDPAWPSQSIVVLDGQTLEVVDHFRVDREGYLLLPPPPVAPGWRELTGTAAEPYREIGRTAGVEHLRTAVTEAGQVRSTYRHELGAWFGLVSSPSATGDTATWLTDEDFVPLDARQMRMASAPGPDGQTFVRGVQGNCRIEVTISPPAEATLGVQLPDEYADYVAQVLLPATAAQDCA